MKVDDSSSFDLVLVGSGFASSFFLHSYLKKAPQSARVLVLEKFPLHSHQWQLKNRGIFDDAGREHFINRNPEKEWIFSPAFGGGSNCWWACTPRFMPNDFKLHSTYGVGVDWPLSYEDLEPFYSEVEELMQVSGSSESSPYPRSHPLPQPPHRLSNPEEALKKSFPGLFFQIPCARGPRATKNRPGCCGTGVCRHCPIDAKFTVLNEMLPLYRDPRVTLLLEAGVEQLETSAGSIATIVYRHEGKEKRVRGDLIALGANALFNPHILLRSGITHPMLGKNLHEQIGVSAVLDLAGMDNFQGSASLSGHGYMFYEGAHRSNFAACVIETSNIPENLRLEAGRWRQRLQLKFVFEDIPSPENFITVSKEDPRKPEVHYAGNSDYVERAAQLIEERISVLARALPIERIVSIERGSTQNHIQGTTLMGNDPKTSIVDRHLVHHQYRNLLLLGSGVFPSCSPVNPTLTLSALSLWAAGKVF